MSFDSPPKEIHSPCICCGVADEGSCCRAGRHSGASLNCGCRVRMQRPEYIKRDGRAAAAAADYQSWWQMCFKQIGVNSSRFLSVVFKVATSSSSRREAAALPVNSSKKKKKMNKTKQQSREFDFVAFSVKSVWNKG